MIDLYHYDDYRDFLYEHYKETKARNANYSYRYICQKVGFKTAFLSRLFKKETHLGLDKIESFCQLLKLTESQANYFSELVRYGRAKNDDDREKSATLLKQLRGISFRTLAEDEAEFFHHTHNMTIRSLLGITPCTPKDHKKISRLLFPVIEVSKVDDSIALLQRLGMVLINEEGFYEVTEKFISTKEEWSSRAIHEYQKKNIQLSEVALEELPKTERDISTVTFTIHRSLMPELREKIKLLREDMLRLSEEGTDDDLVMHLNLQLFPAATTGEVQ